MIHNDFGSESARPAAARETGPRGRRPLSGTAGVVLRSLPFVLALLLVAGCAKYNTFFNAKRSFDNAETVREEALRRNQDPPKPAGTQRADYENAIRKAQKILDEYPGHSLTDDALFLQAKSHHRLEAYRQSIRKLNLLFQNFPASEYEEEALYLQALNFLLIGSVDTSQEYLDRLDRGFPDSRYQAETRKVSGDNAYALELWEEAAKAYRAYLDLEEDNEERDRIGLKLAQCYWELENYAAAADVLQQISQNSSSPELAFRARLLQARVHVRMADYALVDALVPVLRSEADLYQAGGEVALAEAEALIARDRADDATPLLENMPTDWETPPVKARAAEIMGNVFLARGEWEDARAKYQAALLRRDVLDDEDRVRRLADTLKDYLAADQALPDAKGERVARYKLLQANAMLFGFGRPGVAATLYGEAAVDTAADTTVAARALYGAYVTYRDHLDKPDSAAIYRDQLLTSHPASPQAFEARADTGRSLFGYLLELKTARQTDNFAALSPDERAALEEVAERDLGDAVARRRALDGVRRRMVYLARRDNLVFPPPQAAVEAISAREEERVRATAEADSLRAVGASDPLSGATSAPETGAPGSDTGPPGAPGATLLGRTAVAPADSVAAGTGAPGDPAAGDEEGKGKQDGKDDEDDDKKKKKKPDENWDFLR